MSIEATCENCGAEYDARHGVCPACTPRVETDMDGQKVKGYVKSRKLSSTRLMKVTIESDDSCQPDGPTIVRHADRVTPLNHAAKELVGKA